ncbi:hypothetical protein BDV96DRAFT_682102 [Lophiotrema nucula]|uniref:Prolyl 4-hydroxylase alpha subunit Fe(2+) 2OG dioxygenase domain-containing protein n=1 Tax=Lophiotrema nucula TaxID=690887 RepID=A0A6A5ZRI2_9PLEO|nr:hypothetical protein BDV96DRAFT_682102 [Lophiotrema nucula]
MSDTESEDARDGYKWAGKTDRTVHNALYEALSDIKTPGSFATSGALFPVGLIDPELSVKGIGPIELPLSSEDAQKLVKASRLAPYGHGDQTIVNTDVRNTWETDASDVSFGKGWVECLDMATKKLKDGLGYAQDAWIYLEPYKLLTYEKGAKFEPHQDTQRPPNESGSHFGTLVISMPSRHEGGDVRLTHAEETRTLNTSNFSDCEYQYLAWYSDVLHEIKPIESGVRLAMTFNLYLNHNDVPRIRYLEAGERAFDRLKGVLESWECSSTRPGRPYTLMYILDHKYPLADLTLNALKGNDHMRVDVLKNICDQLGFRIYFALHERYLSCEQCLEWCGDVPKEADIFMDETFIAHVKTLEGRDVLQTSPSEHTGRGHRLAHLEVVYDEITQLNAFDRIADETGEHGFQGNSHSGAEYWYRDTVVVIIPRRNIPAFLKRIWTVYDPTVPKLNDGSHPMTSYLMSLLEGVRLHGKDSDTYDELKATFAALKFRGAEERPDIGQDLSIVLDKVAALAIKFENRDMFRQACRLRKLTPPELQNRDGACAQPHDTVLAFAKRLYPKAERLTLQDLNWWISTHGSMRERIHVCKLFTKAYTEQSQRKSPCSRPMFDTLSPLDLTIWKTGRICDAINEIHHPEPGDLVLLIQTSSELSNSLFLYRAIPFISKKLRQSSFLLETLEYLWASRVDIGPDLASQYAAEAVTTAYQVDCIDIDWYGTDEEKEAVASIVRLGEAFGKNIPSLLVAFLQKAVNDMRDRMQFLILFFEQVSESQFWARPDVLDSLCEAIIDPLIDELKFTRHYFETNGVQIGDVISLVSLIDKLKLPSQLNKLVRKLSKMPKLDPNPVTRELLRDFEFKYPLLVWKVKYAD